MRFFLGFGFRASDFLLGVDEGLVECDTLEDVDRDGAGLCFGADSESLNMKSPSFS